MPASARFRLAALGLVALALLVALPGGVLAGKPTRVVIPAEDNEDFVLLAGDACAFDVLVHTEGGLAFLNFFDADGNFVRQILTVPGGSGRQTLTNVATGSSVTVNISGPGVFTVNADGTATQQGTGPWTWFGPLPRSTTSGLFLIRGKFVITFDVDGNPTSFTHSGPAIVDLCAQLAE
jgi:hypothetical protein